MNKLVAFLNKQTRGAIKTPLHAFLFIFGILAAIGTSSYMFLTTSKSKIKAPSPASLQISSEELARVRGGNAPTTSKPKPAPAPTSNKTVSTQKMGKETEKGVVTTTAPVVPYLQYRYKGEQYRDPFVPLNSSSNMSQLMTVPPLSTFLLKGVVQDTKGKVALFSSGNRSFIMRGGRFYDTQNKQIKGISGVVKPNSVLLISADKTTRELKIPSIDVPSQK